jgi:hypothetical protein
MIGRPGRHRSFPGGSPIPPQEAIVAPGASYAVARHPVARDPGGRGTPAVEMAALWKPQNGFHSALEISHTTRDSHIPTADHSCLSHKKKTTKNKTYERRAHARQLDRRPPLRAR